MQAMLESEIPTEADIDAYLAKTSGYPAAVTPC